MTTFTHHPRFTEGPWTFDPTRIYEQTANDKPKGFWLSVDDDWRRWCNDNEFDWADADSVPFEVDPGVLLWLRTADDLERFTLEHSTWDERWLEVSTYRLDWPKVAQHHAGIVITPYQWRRRLALSWYDGWDCASACVWDLSAVSVVVPA